jgi:hypothetical protein
MEPFYTFSPDQQIGDGRMVCPGGKITWKTVMGWRRFDLLTSAISTFNKRV